MTCPEGIGAREQSTPGKRRLSEVLWSSQST